MPLRSVSTAHLSQAGDLAGNPGQQAAYDSTGNCVVLAGPGSGKTKTLVLKLARIMAEDVRAGAKAFLSRCVASEAIARTEVVDSGGQREIFWRTRIGVHWRDPPEPVGKWSHIGTEASGVA